MMVDFLKSKEIPKKFFFKVILKKLNKLFFFILLSLNLNTPWFGLVFRLKNFSRFQFQFFCKIFNKKIFI